MVDITLSKKKYRNPDCRVLRRNGIDPPEGTRTFNGGRFKSKSSNAGKAAKAMQGWGVRKRAYGPF
jgi:hypothetical protein